jgi:hypothetical protein
MNALISLKELSGALGRSPPYIAAMIRNGFPARSGRTTIKEARAWLEKHPHPLHKNGARKYRQKKL